jgi:hypothetical protein
MPDGNTPQMKEKTGVIDESMDEILGISIVEPKSKIKYKDI